ncbi:transglycosylase domain-containing protein [Paraherbaspirillum soli]|uniref:peptidoglycan glycosyltransferase n=1 Tax=Paraherbaspirillum soli TaxID=631222 RepID=A0ABW0MFI4_9BURK
MQASKASWVRRLFKAVIVLGLLALIGVTVQLVNAEMRTSAYQARFFADLAGPATYQLGSGLSSSIRFPHSGPYDKRLGYSQLPTFLDKLQSKDFEISQQARMSPRMTELIDEGIFVPYREKTQAGLIILDCRQQPLFGVRYPERVYDRFEDLPPLLIDSLLFIENRELLNAEDPKRNPAVEWNRLGKAVLMQALHKFSTEDKTPGGSTLATQIEKYRHSPGGRTASIKEKVRQMVSAAVRAYQQGEDTTAARRQIVLDYMNTMPLSAKPGYGEIHGLGDGMWAWYGRDFGEVNQLLRAVVEQTENRTYAENQGGAAQAYKQALSLLISQRRPSHFFGGNAEQLDELTNSYLRLLANAGVISPALRDAALRTTLSTQRRYVAASQESFVARKAATSMRTQLGGLLGISRLYDLDRYDLTVLSTLDLRVQNAVTGVLLGLRDPAKAEAAGLHQKQLLDRGDPSKVIYSFTLYERGENANYLRVQTDNFDQPFDINMGTKLDLGSTAKLRTLVTYLEIVASLHQRYGDLDAQQLHAVPVDPQDPITRWAIDYLAIRPNGDASLSEMLEAALERRYSANPGEQFFTGGGLHSFVNFKREDNSRVLTVREGLRNSVNLVFVRLMRDVVHHYMFRNVGDSARLLQDADDPRRRQYLSRFADQEGRVYLQRFFRKYQGKSSEQMEQLLLHGLRPTPPHLASVYLSIAPDASFEQFSAFIKNKQQTDKALTDKKLAKLYAQYSPQKMSLADRGYVASVHPLELWMVAYLRAHPDADWAKVTAASADQRQQVYHWLFSSRRKPAQDKRIRNLLEVDGFKEIHRDWKRLGYPFDSMVPSYASALGASADRPAALAELMGIIVNDGVRKPNSGIESLRFAADTPYDTLLQHRTGNGEQVLPPEVAQALRGALREVVADGTAKRINGTFVRTDGSAIQIGGKTGTGDHRFNVYGPHGQLIESRVVSRSATFVFNIEGRFFGTLTAHVPGPQAARYDFTSALPVQLLKMLAPNLMPLIDTPVVEAGQGGACGA